MARSKYQSLDTFLLTPFGRQSNLQTDTSYAKSYRDAVAKTKIKIAGFCVIEDAYYYHVKVPSESKQDQNYTYDVVIRFFPESEMDKKAPDLLAYKLQFFSNSPGFMYRYAYDYKQEGFLIEALYNKLDADYIDVPPKNPNRTLSYDKSIYMACRYLSETKFRNLNKRGAINAKKKVPAKFFQGISDFQSVKLDQAIMSEERRLTKELEKSSNRTVASSTITATRDRNKKVGGRKIATNSTLVDKTKAAITVKKKKHGGFNVIKKKGPVRSTFKKR